MNGQFFFYSLNKIICNELVFRNEKEKYCKKKQKTIGAAAAWTLFRRMCVQLTLNKNVPNDKPTNKIKPVIIINHCAKNNPPTEKQRIELIEVRERDHNFYWMLMINMDFALCFLVPSIIFVSVFCLCFVRKTLWKKKHL